jgi:hypothetical protein
MKKHNLFRISLSAAVLATAILFTGCPGEAEKPVDNTPVENTPVENPDAKDPATENPTTKTNKNSVPKISFNISNAKALASSTASAPDRAAARNANSDDQTESEEPAEETPEEQSEGASEETSEEDISLEKIMDDGTVEPAMTIQKGDGFSSWANLDAVIKPPASANSTDILLHFDETSIAEFTNENGSDECMFLGSLILVHEDNSYDNILNMESENKHPDFVRYSSCAKYTPDGKILYLSEKYDPNDRFNFKCYNPSTKTTSLIFELERGDDNSQITSFQMSDDGKYVYLLINSNNMVYLKVISIDNKSDSVDLGKIVYGVDGWTYSSYDDCLYYTVRDKEKEDHVAETGEPFQFIYKIDKTGKGEKELLKTEFCPAIIPTAENKAWRIFSVGNLTDDTIKTTVLENLVSPDADKPETIEFDIPSIHIYSDKFLQVGDTIYLLHERWNEDFTMHLHTIYSVNTSTGKAVNVMTNIPDTDKISISSWSANEENLFISGVYENGNTANFKVDLNTLEPTEIDSSTAFTCIAAL